MAKTTKSPQYDRETLTDMVLEHARRNYEVKGKGWDILIECFDRSDITASLRSCTTFEGAKINARALVADQAAYRDEIQAEAF